MSPTLNPIILYNSPFLCLGDCREGTRSCTGGQAAYSGYPTSASVWHAKRLVGFPRFAYGMASDMGGTSGDTMMASSWMGIRFPGPETIPCLVLFLD